VVPTPPWTKRYLIVCEEEPVYATDSQDELLVYLWGRVLQRYPGGPFRYVVYDYEKPYPLKTLNLLDLLHALQGEP